MFPLHCRDLDYKNKVIGIGEVIETTGDIHADFETIKIFYQDKTGYSTVVDTTTVTKH